MFVIVDFIVDYDIDYDHDGRVLITLRPSIRSNSDRSYQTTLVGVFKSFLRYFPHSSFRLDASKHNLALVDFGVLQSSIVGPLNFTLYVAGLLETLPSPTNMQMIQPFSCTFKSAS